MLRNKNLSALCFFVFQNQQFELDLLNERGKEILRQADEANRRTIDAQLEAISSDWRELVSGLEGRRSTLEALYEHWEEFENQWTNVEARLNEIEERNKFTQTIVRSRDHLLDTIGVLNVIMICFL